MNVVDSVIARNFRDEAEKRGYIVVVPAAPNDQLFFEGGERIFPEFLKQILADYKIQDNKIPISPGRSNGGIAVSTSSFADTSEYFLVHHRVSRLLSLGGNSARTYQSHLENVHQHVRRGAGPHGVAGLDAEAGVGLSGQGHDRAVLRRKGTAPSFGNPRGRERGPAVRPVRTGQARLWKMNYFSEIGQRR